MPLFVEFVWNPLQQWIQFISGHIAGRRVARSSRKRLVLLLDVVA